MSTVRDSPNVPRPGDALVLAVADALARVERNYGREGSGPGSRFEGRLLEDVQAELAVRMAREYRSALPEEEAVAGFSLEDITDAALNRAEHLAHVVSDCQSTDLVNALRRRAEIAAGEA